MFLTSLFRGVRLALFACTLALATSVAFAQSVALPGHLPPMLGSAKRLNRVDAGEQVSLALVLPLRNQAQLNALLHRLYTPGDLLYGQYLTPDTFAQQFAPTLPDYNAVIAFAQSQGLTVTATHPNRTVVDVVGNAQAVEQAFGLQLHQYQDATGRLFRAPSNEPQIPALLSGRLAAVIGLDTAAVWHAHNVEKPRPPQAGGAAPLVAPHVTGSGPGGGLAPTDIKTAYSLNTIGATGTGETLGLFELDGYKASDISGYESYFSLANVPLQNVLVDSASGAAGSGAVEVTLDIELQIATAPSISKIYVYEGPNSNTGVVDTYNRIATDNLAKSISTSWGEAENYTTSSIRNSESQAFQQMAAQGQSIFAASGDSGAYDNGSTLSVDDPASQPYMTGVGGTSLLTNGAGGAWKSETTWNGGSVNNGAGGGGISTVWAKPTYQSSYGASSTYRNVPDVSLNADPNNGYSVFIGGGWSIYGGTSCAAPIWSAFVACVNQSRVAAAKGTLGFANPALYLIGAGSDYGTDFHDIADNSTNLYYHATTGYDNATGWGSIKGAGLFTDLVNGTSGSTGTAPSAPTNLAATAGNAQVSLSWTTSTGATSYNVYRSTTSGSGYAVVGTATTGSYLDTAVTNGTAYYYVVTAVNASGESPKSAQVSATPTAPATAPNAPTNLQATAGNAQVSLSWTASSGAASYKVYRSTTSGSGYTVVGAPTAVTYIDSSVTNGTTYYYVVSAVNTHGESPKSAQVSATPTSTVTGPSQLLGNPGFENGANGAPWVATAGVFDNSPYEPAHSGSWKAWLDGYGVAHTDTLAQTVTIPATITTATLTFWLHIDSAETTTTQANDTLKVEIRNSAGTVLTTLATYSNLNKASGYTQKTFDLSAYKGQTITLYLIGVENGSRQTSFVVDDFALNVK